MTTNEIPYEFLCPITLGIMIDPVICDDGNTYERSAILKLQKSVSPITREPIDKTKLIPNRALKKLIDKYCKLENIDIKQIIMDENKIENPNCKLCIINDKYNCNSAVKNGHLDCLKYAYEEDDSSWNMLTSKIAAEHGHFDCLKYAHDYFNFY